MKSPLPADIPPEAVPFLDQVGYLEPDRLGPGDPVPDLPLHRLEGPDTTLHTYRRCRPLVLLFGSFT